MTKPNPNHETWKTWAWPVPVINGRHPVVSDTFQMEKTEKHRRHPGVDIMFRKVAGDPEFPVSSKMFTAISRKTPVIATADGKIWSAGMTPRGLQVTVDHGNVPGVGPTVTWYQHLSALAKDWKKGDSVKRGQVLGLMGGDPIPGGHALIHLHFELWFPKKGAHPHTWNADPLLYLKNFEKLEIA